MMKKLMSLMLLLGVGLFVVGCGGGETTENTEEETTSETATPSGAKPQDSAPVSRENRAEDGSDER